VTYIDPVAFIVFLVAVPIASLGAIAFGVAICRGGLAERRRRAASTED
jgi:hypothetical protein